jgi:hypothetical protein
MCQTSSCNSCTLAIMGSAIIGLIGVIIGALLSGGFTVLNKRVSEKQEKQALTRIIEDDLGLVASKLAFTEFGSQDHASDNVSLLFLLRTTLGPLQTQEWESLKSKLASLLGKGDWYAVAKAYSSIALLRQIISARDTERFLREGPPVPFGEMIEHFAADIRAGATAMSKVAGNPDPRVHDHDFAQAGTGLQTTSQGD